MYKRLIIITLIFAVYYQITFAQNRIDCIYSKNGNIYKGYIVKKTIDSIKILNLSGNSMVISKSEIDSIVKGNKRIEIRRYKSLIENNRGRFNLFEASKQITRSDELGIGFSYYSGYKFNTNFSLAMGIGFIYKSDFDNNANYYKCKLSLLGRYDFLTYRDHPFVSFEAGLQRIFYDPKLARAPFWHAALGYYFKKRNGKAVLLSAGITQDMNRYVVYENKGFGMSSGPKYYSDWYYTYNLVLKLGYKF